MELFYLIMITCNLKIGLQGDSFEENIASAASPTVNKGEKTQKALENGNNLKGLSS